MDCDEKKYKMTQFNEMLAEEYRREGMKTQLNYSAEYGNGVFENSFNIYENQDYVAMFSLEIDLLEKESKIYHMEVVDSIRGKGYGKRILSGLEKSLKEIDIEKIEIIPKDKHAENFWKKNKYDSLQGDMVKFL